jgi:hypothetical protein
MKDHERLLSMLREEFPHSTVVQRDGDVHIDAKGAGVCDFCEEPLVPKPCPCCASGTFTKKIFDANPCEIRFHGMPPYISEGAWEACALCAAYIILGDREALLNHAVSRAVGLSDTPRRASADTRSGLAIAHDAFWKAKKP